jgi:hypothetical protein
MTKGLNPMRWRASNEGAGKEAGGKAESIGVKEGGGAPSSSRVNCGGKDQLEQCLDEMKEDWSLNVGCTMVVIKEKMSARMVFGLW